MEAKTALRGEIRASRRARTTLQRREAAVGLRDVVLAAPQVARARRAACYVSTVTEPGTGPLREALRSRGCQVLLPVVTGSSQDAALDWAADDGSLDEAQPWSVPQPPGACLGRDVLASCDVVLVPALAVDLAGARLGQGGGYYDRALVAAPVGCPVVALVHDEELLPVGAVPVLPHDVRVDAVATPTRWVVTAVPGRAALS